MSAFKNAIRGSLPGRRLIVGVTGGIAAYKAPLLVRLFRQAEADVQVMMTPDAARFVTPLTLGTLSGRGVLTEIFPEEGETGWTRHIDLGLWADLLIIAPATAQTISKLASGSCDSMLTATVLAARCPILVCPAMDHDMLLHPATQRNLEVLRGYGYEILEPEHGELASGLVGEGRLPEPEAIFKHVAQLLTSNQPLSGKRVLVTAGPTQEAIDPVRYVSNHSSGKMGFSLAREAKRLGADVTLVAGPTALQDPAGVRVKHIVSTAEMKEAVEEHLDADIIVMAAAVADYAPADPAQSKMKKKDEELQLQFRKTPDILKEIGKRKRNGQVLVGFALETDNPLQNAREKLRTKNCDYIVLNSPRDAGAGFGTDTNKVTLLSGAGLEKELPLMSKQDVAAAIFDEILRGGVGRRL